MLKLVSVLGGKVPQSKTDGLSRDTKNKLKKAGKINPKPLDKR